MEVQKSESRFRISILEILWEPIFRQNKQFWIFGHKFPPKWILGSESQKSKSRFRISILEILCAAIFRQNGQPGFFRPKFAQIGFWNCNFKNLRLDSEWPSLRYYGHQFSDKTDKLEVLGVNLPNKEFCGPNFKNLGLDSESASLRYSLHQFSDKTDIFEFPALNLPKKSLLGLKFQN